MEAPVYQGIKAVARLAIHLREIRDAAGCTNPDLARLLQVDESTVRRAASGRSVPKRPLVEAWAQTCGAERERAVAFWRQARYRERRIRQGRPHGHLPNPDLITTREMLSDALVELYERAGAPTMREMAERGGSFGVLPHSTAHRIVTRQTLPGTEEQLRAYLAACEVTTPERWVKAWHRTGGGLVSGGIAFDRRMIMQRLAGDSSLPAAEIWRRVDTLIDNAIAARFRRREHIDAPTGVGAKL